MNYEGEKPYVFVSYSHSDRNKVENILGYMTRVGIRFWYDDAIDVGKNWKDVIDNKLDHSSCFLLFLSNVAHQRDEVIRELKQAVALRNKHEDYRIVVVMLEYVPIRYVFKNDKELCEIFEKLQYLLLPKYGGVTIEFLKNFLSLNLWPEDFREKSDIKESAFTAQLFGTAVDTIDDKDEVMAQNDYIYHLAYPRICSVDGIRFYQVRIGETDKNSVYPICMDNQWCPTELLNRRDFKEKGFDSKIVSMRRKIAQMNEIHRALLHNWQLIINRASIFNTDALISIYAYHNYNEQQIDQEGNFKAFNELMENGSIVVFLFRERTPIEEPKFDHDKIAFEEWKKLCQEHIFYFIRLDWDDENNKTETDIRISAQFRNMLMCVADDKNRLNVICDVLNIPVDKRDSFRDIWKQIRSSIIHVNDNNGIDNLVDYKREELYKEYLILNQTDVNHGILDRNKPFVNELKRIVDLCYSFNLPHAIGVRPVSDYDDELWNVLSSEMCQDPNVRLLSVDELYCAVMSFVPDFIDRNVCYPLDTIVNISEVSTIRKMPQWNFYMQMVDAGRKRSSLNEIDYSDIRKIWLSFHEMLGAYKQAGFYHNWVERNGSLTIIYYFGEYKLTAIYNSGCNKIKIIPHKGNITFSRARGSLRIEFVCVDIKETKIKNTPYFGVQCLFDGRINEPSHQAYETILAALKESEYEIVENDRDE